MKRPEIGQRIELSPGDINQAKKMYHCPSKSVCLSVRLSVCLSVCPSVCLSVVVAQSLAHLSSLTSSSNLSIFRDSISAAVV